MPRRPKQLERNPTPSPVDKWHSELAMHGLAKVANEKYILTEKGKREFEKRLAHWKKEMKQKGWNAKQIEDFVNKKFGVRKKNRV